MADYAGHPTSDPSHLFVFADVKRTARLVEVDGVPVTRLTVTDHVHDALCRGTGQYADELRCGQ